MLKYAPHPEVCLGPPSARSGALEPLRGQAGEARRRFMWSGGPCCTWRAEVSGGAAPARLSPGGLTGGAARRYAASNTRRNVESCGILGGTLNVANGVFSITTLIIPKQQGTSDTVEARPPRRAPAAAPAHPGRPYPAVSLCKVRWGAHPGCTTLARTSWRPGHTLSCTRRARRALLCGPLSVVPRAAGAGGGGDVRGAGLALAVPAGLDPHAPQPVLLPVLGGRAHALRLPGARPAAPRGRGRMLSACAVWHASGAPVAACRWHTVSYKDVPAFAKLRRARAPHAAPSLSGAGAYASQLHAASKQGLVPVFGTPGRALPALVCCKCEFGSPPRCRARGAAASARSPGARRRRWTRRSRS